MWLFVAGSLGRYLGHVEKLPHRVYSYEDIPSSQTLANTSMEGFIEFVYSRRVVS